LQIALVPPALVGLAVCQFFLKLFFHHPLLFNQAPLKKEFELLKLELKKVQKKGLLRGGTIGIHGGSTTVTVVCTNDGTFLQARSLFLVQHHNTRRRREQHGVVLFTLGCRAPNATHSTAEALLHASPAALLRRAARAACAVPAHANGA
jgi:hypothetical protein